MTSKIDAWGGEARVHSAGGATADGAATPAPTVLLVCTGVRPEEKMLVEAFHSRSVELAVVDDRLIRGNLASWPDGLPHADAILLRSKSHWRNLTLAKWMESLPGSARVVNSSRAIETCGDKILTTLALNQAGVRTLAASVAFTPEGGMLAGDAVGYPLVVKPVIGSWGRLIGRVNDRDALETALDHKEALGGAPHAVAYLQGFVQKKGGRDIRSFVVGGRCIAAIYRTSEHWKTNTALGAVASACTVDAELAQISTDAAAAVGGGVVAVDLFETDEGYVVNEVNGTMEFRNSVHTTGVDIPGAVVEYVLSSVRDATAVR